MTITIIYIIGSAIVYTSLQYAERRPDEFPNADFSQIEIMIYSLFWFIMIPYAILFLIYVKTSLLIKVLKNFKDYYFWRWMMYWSFIIDGLIGVITLGTISIGVTDYTIDKYMWTTIPPHIERKMK